MTRREEFQHEVTGIMFPSSNRYSRNLRRRALILRGGLRIDHFVHRLNPDIQVRQMLYGLRHRRRLLGFLSKELGMPEDALINLPNFEARVKRIADGSPTEAIHIRTLLPHPDHAGRLNEVLAHTRNRHARQRPVVEDIPLSARPKRKRL